MTPRKDEVAKTVKPTATQAATTTKRKSGGVAKAVGAVIAGAALGYVAGALTAPASGKETRRRLGRRVEEEKAAIAGKAKKSLTRAKDSLATARKSMTQAKDKLADKLHS